MYYQIKTRHYVHKLNYCKSTAIAINIQWYHKEMIWKSNHHHEMHSNAYKLIFKFKLALYFSALLMKLVTVVEGFFYTKIIIMKLKPSLLIHIAMCFTHSPL